MQDLRYALRTLRRQPGFTLVAVLTLTLGIGANTAIFSLLHQVVLRPLPFRDPGQLVFVWNSGQDGGQTAVSIPDFLDRLSQAPAIEDATLFTPRSATLSGTGRPEPLTELAVTPSFFSTLGRAPMLGRGFTADEAVPGADRRVVLTHAFWRSRFGADPGIVGRAIPLNGEDHLVVGVLPADVELPIRDVSLLVPFAFTPAQVSDAERGNEFSQMIARLRPGATVEQVNAQMKAIVSRLIDRLPERAAFMRTSGFTGVAVPIRDQLVGDARAPLFLLQSGVLLVLLIACANVANLLLMRATGRARELAIRSTLGAGRRRIARQLIVEGLVLAAFGAAGGLVVAAAGIQALVAMVADQLPAASAASVDPAVFGFTAVVALLTGIVFGAVPMVSVMRGSSSAALKEAGTRTSAGARTGAVRRVLVVAELALAVMLLVGAGLLIKSFARVTRVSPGFSTDHVLSAQLTLPSARYTGPPAMRRFWTALLDATRAIPGVRSVALTGAIPFTGQDGSGTYTLLDRPPGPGDRLPHAFQQTVGGDYFRAMEIPVLEGRVFTEGDTPDAPRVVVIDEYLATHRFPGVSAIGRQVNFGSPRNYTVIGVVGTINGGDLARPVPEERIYFHVAQVPQSIMGILLKSAVDPASLAPQLRAAVESVDPELPISAVGTLDLWRARSLQLRRTPTTLLAVFALVALVLAAIGTYGVLAFGVAQRAREFGIRQALGAGPRSIRALVLVQGIRTAVAGIALGLGGALALTRYLQSLLFGVTTRDPAVFAGAAVTLLGVALVACYIPARHATRVDPMVAMRES